MKNIDIEGVVRCKDCCHRPVMRDGARSGFDLYFPDGECPLCCDDPYYSTYPDDDWFCANGESDE